MGHRRFKLGFILFLIVVLLGGCGRSRYGDTGVIPAELEGKDKAWFEKNWGKPMGKAKRFFGGEAWTYFRITGNR